MPVIAVGQRSNLRIKEIGDFPVLEATVEAEHLAGAIIEAGAIPVRAVRDAAHIAIAAVNDIDYLLTWNCRHLQTHKSFEEYQSSAMRKDIACRWSALQRN